MIFYFRNPNNYTDKFLQDMHWPKHDVKNEFYLDIGEHLTEKHGLFLDRYKAWEEWDRSLSQLVSANRFILTALAVFTLVT